MEAPYSDILGGKNTEGKVTETSLTDVLGGNPTKYMVSELSHWIHGKWDIPVPERIINETSNSDIASLGKHNIQTSKKKNPMNVR